MVASEAKSSCQLVVTFFFFFFFGLTLPNYRNKSGSAQPPLISTTSSAAAVLYDDLNLKIVMKLNVVKNACTVSFHLILINGAILFAKNHQMVVFS